MQDKGSVTLEFSLIYAMLLGLLLTVFHFGLLYHTSLAVSDAADVGLEVVQTSQEPLESLETSVQDVVEDLIGRDSLLSNLETSIKIVDSNAIVSVSANSPQIIWGLPNQISKQASGSLERFLQEAERR